MLIFALNIICWVRIVQRVGYEMSEPGYESSGYERSMGTKRLDTVSVKNLVTFVWILNHVSWYLKAPNLVK